MKKKRSKNKIKTSSGDHYTHFGLEHRSVGLLRIELGQVTDFPKWGEKHLFNAQIWVKVQ